MRKTSLVCRNCSASISKLYKGVRCPFCLTPDYRTLKLKPSKRERAAMRRRERKEKWKPSAPPGGDPAMARRRERRAVREDERLAAGREPLRVHDPWLTAHPGNPLGRGFPVGSSLREEDGQSHREAWQALLRRDPCAYCSDAGPAGTIDHIIPRSQARVGEGHAWLNYTGACPRCNGSKKDTTMLVWLARRGVLASA